MAKQATAHHIVNHFPSQPLRVAVGRDLEEAISRATETAPHHGRMSRSDATDTLVARIKQARAALVAVQCTWDDGLTPKSVYHALWAVEELLGQGVDAAEVVAATE